MGKLDFYYAPLSPPCRIVMLTAKALDVELNLKHLDILAGATRTPEFLAINPQHTVPTFVDGDLVLWESRAISQYLAQQYGKDDSLYPKDPKKRALVDRMLYFDMGTLYQRWSEFAYPVLFAGQPINPKKLESFHEALGWLDGMLAGKKYAIGDHITIADHSLIGCISSVGHAGDYLVKHKNIVAWLERCEDTMPGYAEVNTPGAMEFGGMAKKGLSK